MGHHLNCCSGRRNKHPSVQCLSKNMNPFSSSLVICTYLVTLVTSLPQNYGSSGDISQDPQTLLTGKNPNLPDLPEGCRIQYKTVFDIIEKDIIETKCDEKYRDKCETKYKKVCNPYQEEVCTKEYKNICETKYKDKCYEAYNDVQEEYVEKECTDKDIAVCDKHWQCSTPNVPLSNCNDKVWVDNLDTCKYLKKSICKDVTKYRTVQKPYQKCDQVPYDECRDVPFDSCDLITKETCQNNAYEDCIQVPYQDCKEVHKLVPEQVSKKIPFKVCEGSKPQKLTDREIEDLPDIIDPFGRTDVGIEPRTEEVKFEDDTKKKASNAIVFG